VSYDVENLHDTALRRCVDLLVALAGLVVLSPVLLVLMLAVRLSSPGPALYRQPRVGRGQREFAIVKLRTMVVGSDRQGGLVTGNADPRVTALGRFLRGCRLDELPQLVNLLRGEMTLVGPRPEVPRFLPFYTDREKALFRVRPGVIGPGALLFATEQVQELDDADDPESVYVAKHLHPKLRCDLDYLTHRSLGYDLRLILETAWVVGGRK
jgi:lipopolysaccharide/colanic/teichoic acid biosynthesis glycosyltransferase